MKRCPQCHRFGVEYDPYTGTERCLWNDCLWINEKNIDVEKEEFPLNFTRFRRIIKVKRNIVEV